MADEKEKQEEQKAQMADEKTDKKTDESQTSKKNTGLLKWITLAAVIVLCACAGFGVGRLFGSSRKTAANESPQKEASAQIEDLKTNDSAAGPQKSWYYVMEPVVANLDVPGVTRFVRVSLILQISSELDEKKGTDFLNTKKPVLTNWLNIYLASLSLEDIRGDKNLRRIQSQIIDAFNEKLFPGSKPQISEVLFKEFAIQ